MEILVFLDGRMVYTHFGENAGAEREALFHDAIRAAVGAGVLAEAQIERAFCKFGQP